MLTHPLVAPSLTFVPTGCGNRFPLRIGSDVVATGIMLTPPGLPVAAGGGLLFAATTTSLLRPQGE